MTQEKRFGRRVTEPSSLQIIHELKLVALRQSLDAATTREAAEGARHDAIHDGVQAAAATPEAA